MANWRSRSSRRLQDNPGFCARDWTMSRPRHASTVQIDQDKAASLGVSAQSIGRALETMFGSRRVTTYIKSGQEYDVMLQTSLEQRRSIEDLNRLNVRTNSGAGAAVDGRDHAAGGGDTPDRPRVDRLRSVTLTTRS
ncbi:efflux RND transporter permease subunit [Caulobacter segnis]